MGVEILLAGFFAIAVTFVFIKIKRDPVSLEEVNHLASVEDLRVAILSANPQPFDLSRYFLIYGNLFFCKYHFRGVMFGKIIYLIETIETRINGRDGRIIATFTNGHLTSWKLGHKKTVQQIESGDEHFHEIWLLEQLFATVGNALITANKSRTVD